MKDKIQRKLSFLYKAIICMVVGFPPIYECAALPEECNSTTCHQISQHILKHLDMTVDPCDNFHQFACGKFLKETMLPEDKQRVGLIIKKTDVLQEKLKKSIEAELEEGDPKTFKLLQSFYNACLNTEKIEETSMDQLKIILNSIGNWPVVMGRTWNESNFDWQKLTHKLRELGFIDSMKSIVKIEFGMDQKNTSRSIITLDQAKTGIEQEYLSKGLKEKVVQAYYKYMVELAEMLGADHTEAEKELAESLNFEIKLAKISLASDKRRNLTKLYNLKIIGQLQSEYPYIPWNDYLNRLVSPQSHIDFTDNVIVKVPSFLESLSALLSKTPKRVLANYMVWRVVQESAEYMNEQVRKVKAKFTTSLIGTTVEPPRWVKCIDYVSLKLPLATDVLYVRKNFDEKTKSDAEKLVNELRKSFGDMIKKLDWMDEETKKAAQIKLTTMKAHIAYPDEFFDNSKLDDYFRNLTNNEDSFYKSHLLLSLFNLGYQLEHLRKPVNKTNWATLKRSAVVNAFYHGQKNSIHIPSGILQGEFFSSDRPNYMNYGAIGTIIGHEFTHGFDDAGSQYDKDGNLVNWWNFETQKEYLNRAQCIINQYSNYTVKEVGLNLNGKNTQGENIADNGGLKEAYYAYEAYERQNGEEPRLPGLSYSPKQLFWISNANIFCTKRRSESLKNIVVTNPHSPEEFRVNGPFSNMPEFARDFNCPLGSPMNPMKKCIVW